MKHIGYFEINASDGTLHCYVPCKTARVAKRQPHHVARTRLVFVKERADGRAPTVYMAAYWREDRHMDAEDIETLSKLTKRANQKAREIEAARQEAE